LLKSDYFIHKKGQIIFVSETMVKGKAKNLSTANNIDERKSNSDDKEHLKQISL
jgi:hypothetical protein